MDIGRKADLKEINTALKSRDSLVRKNAQESGDKIKKEQSNRYLKDARESLIKAKLNNKNGDVRDISEQIYKYTKHKDIPVGMSTFGFSIPNYDEIFNK